MPEPHPIVAELRARRREAGLSQRAVARAIHYCPQSVAFWESGAAEPGLDAIAAYAVVLGRRLDLGGGPIVGVLKRHRLDAGLTQADVALKLGAALATVCRWETGRRRPTLASATSYAALFGLELELVVADAH